MQGLASDRYSNITVILNFGKEVINRFCNVICSPPPLDIPIHKLRLEVLLTKEHTGLASLEFL